jgi:hypothetical protein
MAGSNRIKKGLRAPSSAPRTAETGNCLKGSDGGYAIG